MKLRQLLTNKKIVIVSLTVLLALIVALVIFVTPDSNEAGGKDTSSKIEQNKDDTITEDEENKTDNVDRGNQQAGSLEVLQPDEVAPENSSDASGDWEEQSQNDNQESENILKDEISWGEIY